MESTIKVLPPDTLFYPTNGCFLPGDEYSSVSYKCITDDQRLTVIEFLDHIGALYLEINNDILDVCVRNIRYDKSILSYDSLALLLKRTLESNPRRNISPFQVSIQGEVYNVVRPIVYVPHAIEVGSALQSNLIRLIRDHYKLSLEELMLKYNHIVLELLST